MRKRYLKLMLAALIMAQTVNHAFACEWYDVSCEANQVYNEATHGASSTVKYLVNGVTVVADSAQAACETYAGTNNWSYADGKCIVDGAEVAVAVAG